LHSQASVPITLIIRQFKFMSTFTEIDVARFFIKGAAAGEFANGAIINGKTKAIIAGHNKAVSPGLFNSKRRFYIHKEIIAITDFSQLRMFKAVVLGNVEYVDHDFFGSFNNPGLVQMSNASAIFTDNQL